MNFKNDGLTRRGALNNHCSINNHRFYMDKPIQRQRE